MKLLLAAPGIGALLSGTVSAATVSVLASSDTTIYSENSGLSNGSGDSVFVGRTGTGTLRRGLLRFDLADAMPAGAHVQSVELRMQVNQSNNAGLVSIGLHRAVADWGEAGSVATSGQGAAAQAADATWTSRFYDTSAWTSSGGDFTLAASGSTSVGGPGTYVWASTAALVADVQAWLDSPAANFGWFLIGNEAQANTTKRFDSSEATAIGAMTPALFISYTPIPEPTTALLVVFGIATLGVVVKRRARG